MDSISELKNINGMGQVQLFNVPLNHILMQIMFVKEIQDTIVTILTIISAFLKVHPVHPLFIKDILSNVVMIAQSKNHVM